MPGGFVALFIVVAIAGVAMSAANAGRAREIAQRTGDDRPAAERLEELQGLYAKCLVTYPEDLPAG